MGFFDRIVNRNFKTTEDGRKLFFPLGSLGRGYIIPSEEEFQRLQKRGKFFYLWQICEMSIFSLLVIWVNTLTGVIFFLFVIIFNRLWLYSQYRHLEQSDERLVFEGSLTNRIRRIGFLSLCLIEIGAIALVGLGFFFIIVYWQYGPIFLASISLIVFFGNFAILIAKQLMAKRR